LALMVSGADAAVEAARRAGSKRSNPDDSELSSDEDEEGDQEEEDIEPDVSELQVVDLTSADAPAGASGSASAAATDASAAATDASAAATDASAAPAAARPLMQRVGKQWVFKPVDLPDPNSKPKETRNSYTLPDKVWLIRFAEKFPQTSNARNKAVHRDYYVWLGKQWHQQRKEKNKKFIKPAGKQTVRDVLDTKDKWLAEAAQLGKEAANRRRLRQGATPGWRQL